MVKMVLSYYNAAAAFWASSPNVISLNLKLEHSVAMADFSFINVAYQVSSCPNSHCLFLFPSVEL